jgi:hypothetical protein
VQFSTNLQLDARSTGFLCLHLSSDNVAWRSEIVGQ